MFFRRFEDLVCHIYFTAFVFASFIDTLLIIVYKAVMHCALFAEVFLDNVG